MSERRAVLLRLVVALGTALAAADVAALPVCTDRGADDAVVYVTGNDGDSLPSGPGAGEEIRRSEGTEQHPREERILLPCGLADIGPSCADAAFDVVTPSGVVLCRMEIPLWTASPVLELTRSAPATSPSSSPQALAVVPAVARLPGRLVVERVVTQVPAAGMPRDGFRRRLVPPS